jgi:predicted transcriptional regulator
MNQRKRHKLQLFYGILRAIEEDMFQNAEARFAKPTHVLQYSRLSYGKMIYHFSELRRTGMIFRHDENGLLSITNKGRAFVRQYKELLDLIESVAYNGGGCMTFDPGIRTYLLTLPKL